MLLSALFVVTQAGAQSLFNITAVTYGTSASIPAGINGVTLQLAGTLPSAARQNSPGYLGCFYTGYGSTSGLPVSLPSGANTEPLTVPASTIQAIPDTQFTAANGYAVTAYVYFVAAGGTCDGTFDASLTNRFPVQVIAPSLGAYSGPVDVPQTNSATGIQAAPRVLTLPAGGVVPSSSTIGSTTVTFGSFGTVTAVATLSNLMVPVPAAFSSSAPGTTASLSVCNAFGAKTVCTTPTPAIALTVDALSASAATIIATPTPVAASGQTVLSAQFTQAAATGQTKPGAPSGIVSFTAEGATIPAASMVLDTTAVFSTQTTAVTPPTAPAPTITPASGSYFGAQTITIADINASAAIYYTQDGSTPTTSSTPYTAPFTIATSQTVKAVAAITGSLNSAVASAAYVVTVSPPTHLGFQVQPTTSGLNTAIAPPIKVALLDSTGAVALGYSNAVTIAIANNPASGSLAGTRTVNAVNGIATFSNLSISTIGTGYTLIASSGTLPTVTSTAFNITPAPITMAVQSELIGIGSTLSGSFTLSVAAPTGGLVVNLSSGTPANVTIAPATVTVAAGQTTGAFTYTGVAAGDSTLKATATGYQDGTVLTTGTAAQVSLTVPPAVAPAQMQSLALSLPRPAPPGGTTVTFTIANPNIATVTSSVFVPAGAETAAANPQVTGVLIGTTTITATAPGYRAVTLPVVVTVTAAFNPTTTNINLATSHASVLTISAPAPPGGITFTLTSDAPGTATVPATVTVVAGATSAPIAITGVATGTTTIRANSAGITEAAETVNVAGAIATTNFVTGYDLESSIGVSLPVTPINPVSVTVTSNDPTVAIISNSNTVVGQRTLSYPNLTSSYVGNLWIQGLKVGTTTLTIHSSSGYTDGTINVTVLRSGFMYSYYNLTLSTTTFSQPTPVNIYLEPLDANANLYNYGYYVNPGSPNISIPISSSMTSVGTVPTAVVFHANDTSESFNFTPATPAMAGTTNLTIGAPPTGFTMAAQYQTVVATVTAPAIVVYDQTTGVHLQNSFSVSLPVAPPAGHPVDVTVSVPTSQENVTISTSPTVAGTKSLTFPSIAGTNIGTIYIQGQSQGTATLTVAALGYTSGTATMTVHPSGFVYDYYTPFTFSTTALSPSRQLNVYTAVLTPCSPAPCALNLENRNLLLNPGLTVAVAVNDSATGVGTISSNSLVFDDTTGGQSFTFQPKSAGTTTLSLSTPAGFSTPAQYQSGTVTVTADAITVYGTTAGVHLQRSISIDLPEAPPSGSPVTVTVSVPSTQPYVTLSNSATAAGVTTLTFANVTTSHVATIYVQGQSQGSTTLTVAASSGYTAGTTTLNVYPSGFVVDYYNPIPSTTTTFSPATLIRVYTALLSPCSPSPCALTLYDRGFMFNPGVAPVTLTVTDTVPSVGTVSTNSLVFGATDTYKDFTFQPVSAGTTNLSISTPLGFSTPSQYQSGTVMVTAPVININDIVTGVNLDGSLSIYLPQTPPNNNGNGISVIVSTSSNAVATLSTDPLVVGTSSVTFTGVTSTNVGTVYVQGQSVSTAQLTETAPGYTDGHSVVTVKPSGFAFSYNPSITTSVANGPYPLTLYPYALNVDSNTIYGYNSLRLNPGIGNVNVTVTSSDHTVGTINPTPVVFTPGSGSQNLNFVPVGTGTSNLTVQTPTSPSGFSSPSQNVTGTATVQ